MPPLSRTRVFNRRREDRSLHEASPEQPTLPHIAVSWLQDLLRTEFADDPRAPLAGGVPVALAGADADEQNLETMLAVWRREWLRRWRRLQLPEQLASFAEAMDAAQRPEEVHGLLSSHARGIVGAYACLVFLPAGDGRLRPLPDPRLADDGGVWLGPPTGRATALLTPEDVQTGPELAGLASLFDDMGAVALAAAPYGGGTAVLVERRREREFEAVDWELLRTLCAQAEAALHRVALLEGLHLSDPQTGGAARERVDQVLRHGWAGAALGHTVTVMLVRLGAGENEKGEGEEDVPLAESAVRECAAVLRREAHGAGPVLRHGAREFLLVLNADPDAARALLERVRAQTRGRMQLRAGIAPQDPAAGSAHDLLRHARAALDHAG